MESPERRGASPFWAKYSALAVRAGSEPTGKKWFADRYKQAIEKRSRSTGGASRRKENPGRQLKALYYQIDHMHEVPYLLFVCGKCDWPFKVPEHERIGEGPPNYGAVYPCVQNILLACRALGLERP
ncbi:MAG: hypothetical protein Ct9H300mP8_06080 [Gammaproteobacteria bacterium]|nr:MAG: hypothetical protein Ct9H300mP8_06080 [Gammaproteobacteria bacterium]